MEKTKSSKVSETDLAKIVEFIEAIQFGSVSIVIQNGKIVQIEKNEKVRLTGKPEVLSSKLLFKAFFLLRKRLK